MDLVSKYQKDLKEKIETQKEYILQSVSDDSCEEIALRHIAQVEKLKGLEEAFELFEHTLKVFSR